MQNASGPADFEAALARADPPLIDVPRDEARWIAVVGHTQSCWSADDQVLCGFADLADTAGGILEVGLQCGDCREELPFCP